VSSAAKADPNKFYIGIDANVKPLEKPSMKATRKPAKGGLPNALFIQAAVEDLPEDLNGIADEIYIHFPWGSLLRAAATGETDFLASLRRLSAPECLLTIVLGIDPEREKGELTRLGVSELTPEYFRTVLAARYAAAGFRPVELRTLDHRESVRIETSWAKKLSPNLKRPLLHLSFIRTS
jgi:16S rRNA (adenine(1408)-N(1))-methyltransferase